MTTEDVESLELNLFVDYKQIKEPKSEWIYSSIHHSPQHLSSWRLQIDNSHPTFIGVYATLVHGAPCVLQSYKIFMLTNKNPSLMIFINRCTLQRTFPAEPFSWGFQNFCSRRELKDERKLIRDRKTNQIHLRCFLFILNPTLNDIYMDHRFSTDLFQLRSLQEWIIFVRNRCDLLELENRINQEIEKEQKESQ